MDQKYAKLTVVAIAIAGIIITISTIAALSASRTFPLNGTVNTVNVEAYTDSACTIPCTALDVGNVNPGSTVTQKIYIKNSGTIPVTLTMATSNWNPTNAGSYLTLSWNRQNTILNPGASVSATLTLTVASDTGSLEAFTCNVTITGTE